MSAVVSWHDVKPFSPCSATLAQCHGRLPSAPGIRRRPAAPPCASAAADRSVTDSLDLHTGCVTESSAGAPDPNRAAPSRVSAPVPARSEEHTSELQSPMYL